LLKASIGDPKAHHGLAGDLREYYAERRRVRPGWVCALWYWRQVAYASGRYAWERRVARFRRWRLLRASGSALKRHGGDSLMKTIYQDLRYALRMLRKSPGMAAIAMLALTLGTGLPTIMFSIVNGVLRDLPFEKAERILYLHRTDPLRGRSVLPVSHHDFGDWRAQQTSFEGIAGFSTEDVTVSGSDVRPLRRNAAFVTAGAFGLLRVQPVVGREFAEEDEGTAVTRSVIISHAVWVHRFAGDRSVLGRTLVVDGEPRTIIGVMPEGFHFPLNEDLWLPLRLTTDGQRGEGPTLEVFGRLNDGISARRARTELMTIADRLASEYPDASGGLSAGAMPYTEHAMGAQVARGLYTMLAAVTFVLLVACANVANLLLARAVMRSREVAMRTALGATRGRVVFQFLVEAFVLTCVGGLLGLAVAFLGVELFKREMVSVIGLFWIDIKIDAAVMLFVVGTVLAGSLLAGILPAVQASGTSVNEVLKDESRGVSSMRLGRFSKALVVGEIALSCALLVVSGLMIKGVLTLRAVDLGMPVENIVTGEVELPRQTYGISERLRFFEELESRLAAMPGATGVALMSDLPATGGFAWPVRVEGYTGGAEEGLPRVGGMTVTPNFLDVLDARVIEGRGFTARDRAGSEQVVLVNESFARRFFPQQSALGHTIDLGQGSWLQPPRTIIGVVPDLYVGSLEEENANGPGVYFPLAQNTHVSMQVMVKSGGDPFSLVSQMRDVLEALDPSLALMDVDRVDRLIARETIIFEVFGRLFLVFGLTALFLASVGLYGVMAFSVSQRTREWGVRMALGAKGGDVVRLVLGQGVRQIAVGLGLGLVIAGALSVPMSDIFLQVEPWDRKIFATIALLLAATGVVASLIPARRATRHPPRSRSTSPDR
jgi:predicted permease